VITQAVKAISEEMNRQVEGEYHRKLTAARIALNNFWTFHNHPEGACSSKLTMDLPASLCRWQGTEDEEDRVRQFDAVLDIAHMIWVKERGVSISWGDLLNYSKFLSTHSLFRAKIKDVMREPKGQLDSIDALANAGSLRLLVDETFGMESCWRIGYARDVAIPATAAEVADDMERYIASSNQNDLDIIVSKSYKRMLREHSKWHEDAFAWGVSRNCGDHAEGLKGLHDAVGQQIVDNADAQDAFFCLLVVGFGLCEQVVDIMFHCLPQTAVSESKKSDLMAACGAIDEAAAGIAGGELRCGEDAIRSKFADLTDDEAIIYAKLACDKLLALAKIIDTLGRFSKSPNGCRAAREVITPRAFAAMKFCVDSDGDEGLYAAQTVAFFCDEIMAKANCADPGNPE
jgi:hypothetical protein